MREESINEYPPPPSHLGFKQVIRKLTGIRQIIFVSYWQIRILKIGIHIRMKVVQIFKKDIPFIINRIPKINGIIGLQTNRIECIQK